MHVPDHLLDPQTSIATGVAAAVVVATAALRVRGEITRGRMAMAGATSAAIFAAQMVNYPVAPGTSGHLIGAALAVALVGPRLALIVMSAVVVVQALVFGDGGLTAVGTNIILLGVLPVALSALVSALARRASRRVGPRSVTAIGAFVSVPASAAVLAGLYAVGGTGSVDVTAMLASMTFVHLAIGIGEAAISVLVLSLVLALAPGGSAIDIRPAARRSALRGSASLAGVAVVCAAGLSLLSSSDPDGLESVIASYALPVPGAVFAGLGLFGDGGAWASAPAAVIAIAGTVVTAAVATGAVLAAAGPRARRGRRWAV